LLNHRNFLGLTGFYNYWFVYNISGNSKGTQGLAFTNVIFINWIGTLLHCQRLSAWISLNTLYIAIISDLIQLFLGGAWVDFGSFKIRMVFPHTCEMLVHSWNAYKLSLIVIFLLLFILRVWVKTILGYNLVVNVLLNITAD